MKKFNSTFLKLAYSKGEINTNQKMIWKYYEFKELADLKSAVTFKISVPKLFFLEKISDEDFLNKNLIVLFRNLTIFWVNRKKNFK
jgi:hypothetical protein